MKNLILTSPIPGELIALNKVKDPAFSSGAMGAGCGIVPSEGKVFAPFDAKVEVLFDTKHAIGLTGTDGESILIHIGIDTVNLNGKPFHNLVNQGDTLTYSPCLNAGEYVNRQFYWFSCRFCSNYGML